jgi:hypothetical protein
MAGYLTTRFKRTGNNGLLVVHYQTSRLSAEPLFSLQLVRDYEWRKKLLSWIL